jgi:hypothetical protein
LIFNNRYPNRQPFVWFNDKSQKMSVSGGSNMLFSLKAVIRIAKFWRNFVGHGRMRPPYRRQKKKIQPAFRSSKIPVT